MNYTNFLSKSLDEKSESDAAEAVDSQALGYCFLFLSLRNGQQCNSQELYNFGSETSRNFRENMLCKS